jgi:hypothetical protein
MASSLLLSSNNRISSFYWIRGSKHCFLTSFLYLNCYFLIIVFLRNHYLLVSLRLSWLHRNLISHPIFSYLWYSKVLCCTCAPIFLAHIMLFLKARCLQEPGTLESVLIFFPRSAFCQRFLMQTSVGQLQIIPFLLT